MKDYVLREDVLRRVEEDGHDNELDLGYPDHNEAFQEIIKAIPAADVVKVVRCPECVHHVDCGYHFCNMWCENCPDDADFFCAYGARVGNNV